MSVALRSIGLAEHGVRPERPVHLRCSTVSGLDGVAHAAYSAQETVDSGVSEFAANVREMHVDEVTPVRRFFPPNGLMDVRTGVDFAWVTHQVGENLEFRGRKLELDTIAGDEAFRGGKFEVPNSENIRRRNAELDSDAGEQLAWVVRLDDVIVGSEVEKFDFLADGVVGGEDHDTDAGGAFQADEKIAAVAVREIEIQENQIWGVFYGVREALRDAVGMGSLIPGLV